VTTAADRKQYCSRCLTTFGEDAEQCPNLGCRRKKPSRGWGVIFAQGDLFDRTYHIHNMLAVGGAGVTYVARELDGDDQEVGPRIAIKVLLAARDQGPYVRRLATEAQIIQELDHPNIVQYLGFVHRAGHSPYLLTRFEAGGSLLDHMRRVGTLSVQQAALVGRQICWALEKAHERDIVHRDLKPENVLLTRVVGPTDDPVVRVADFGIAKVRGSLGTNLTRVGAFVGTPHYAAPEQFVGGAVTEAADVYALGALIYFTMTARHVVRFADRIDPEDGFQLLCDNLPPKLERPGDDPVAVQRMQVVLAAAMEVDPLARCSVVELDVMLQAVAAGQDPIVPSRNDGLDGDPLLGASGASVLGVAGAVDSNVVPPPVGLAGRAAHLREAPPKPSDRSLSETVRPESFARPVVTEASFERPDAEPPTSPEPRDTPPQKKRRWGLIFFAAAVIMGGGIVVIGGGSFAAIAWLQPDLVSGVTGGKDDPKPTPKPVLDAPELLPDSKSNERDLAAIRGSLDRQRGPIRKACKPKKGASVQLKVVVDGPGTVVGVTAKGKLGKCVSEQLTGATLSRTGDRTVQVTYPLMW